MSSSRGLVFQSARQQHAEEHGLESQLPAPAPADRPGWTEYEHTANPSAFHRFGDSNPGIGIYRQARIRTTLAAAAVLLIPFAVFFFLLRQRMWEFTPGLKHPLLQYLIACVVLGVVLALAFGRVVSNHILELAKELEKTANAVHQREIERDSAQRELVRRLEEERELVKEKLQFEAQLAEYEKYSTLAQLALGAAHEINNPLLGILSHLELELKAARDDEEYDEILQCIEGTKRISATIKGLLNYARPGPLVLSKVNLERLVSDSFEFLCHQPLFRKIELVKEIPADLPAISADANQISQVLMNLLFNSAQAMPQGGTITVSAEKVKFAEKIEIRVSDTGVGIPADILPHVFEPFFTTKRGKGTGLGLSISQTYVRSHSGDIEVESVPYRGTVVRITLPIRQEGASMRQPEEMVG
ncbi:MAG: sensor histidine kinase [Terriglobales bacterium]